MNFGPIFVADEDFIRDPAEMLLNYLKLAGSMNPISVLGGKERFDCPFMYDEVSGDLTFFIADDAEKLTDPIDKIKVSDKLRFYIYNRDHDFIKVQFNFSSIDRFMLSEKIHNKFVSEYLTETFVGLLPTIQALSGKYFPNLSSVLSKPETAKAFASKIPTKFGELLVSIIKNKSWQYTPELAKVPATYAGRLNRASLKLDYISQKNILAVLSEYKAESPQSISYLTKDISEAFETIKGALVDTTNKFQAEYSSIFWDKFLTSPKKYSAPFSDWASEVGKLKNSKDANDILQRSLGVFYESYFNPDIAARFCISYLFTLQANIQVEKSKTLDACLKEAQSVPEFSAVFDSGLLKPSFTNTAKVLLNFEPTSKEIRQSMSKLIFELSGSSRNAAGVATRLAIGIGGAFGLFYVAKNGGFSKKT